MRHPNRDTTEIWIVVADDVGLPDGKAKVYRVPSRELGGDPEQRIRQLADVVGLTLVISETEPASRSAKAVLADLIDWRGDCWPDPQPDWIKRALYRR